MANDRPFNHAKMSIYLAVRLDGGAAAINLTKREHCPEGSFTVNECDLILNDVEV